MTEEHRIRERRIEERINLKNLLSASQVAYDALESLDMDPDVVFGDPGKMGSTLRDIRGNLFSALQAFK